MYPKSFPTSTPVFPWNGNETQTTTVLSPLPATSSFTTPIEKADNEQKWMQQRRDLRDQLGVQQWLQLRQDQISEQEQLRMRKHGVGSTVLESSIPWNSQQMQPVQYMLPKQPTVNPLMHAEITALMTQYLQQKQTDVVSEAMKVKDSKELLSPVDIYEQKRAETHVGNNDLNDLEKEVQLKKLTNEGYSMLGESTPTQQPSQQQQMQRSLPEDLRVMDIQFLHELLQTRDKEVEKLTNSLDELGTQAEALSTARRKTSEDRMSTTKKTIESLAERMRQIQESHKSARAELQESETMQRDKLLLALETEEATFQKELQELSERLKEEGEREVKAIMCRATSLVREEEDAVRESLQRDAEQVRDTKSHWLRQEAKSYLKQRELELMQELHDPIRREIEQELRDAAFRDLATSSEIKKIALEEAYVELRPIVEKEVGLLHDQQLLNLRRRLSTSHTIRLRALNDEHRQLMESTQSTVKEDVERCILEQLSAIATQYELLHGSAQQFRHEVESRENSIDNLQNHIDEVHEAVMQGVRSEQNVCAQVACEADTLRSQLRLLKQQEEAWRAAKAKHTTTIGITAQCIVGSTTAPGAIEALTHQKQSLEKSISTIRAEMEREEKLARREYVMTPPQPSAHPHELNAAGEGLDPGDEDELHSQHGSVSVSGSHRPYNVKSRAHVNHPLPTTSSSELFLLEEMERYRKGGLPKRSVAGGVRGPSPQGTTVSSTNSTRNKPATSSKRGGPSRIPHPLGHIM